MLSGETQVKGLAEDTVLHLQSPGAQVEWKEPKAASRGSPRRPVQTSLQNSMQRWTGSPGKPQETKRWLPQWPQQRRGLAAVRVPVPMKGPRRARWRAGGCSMSCGFAVGSHGSHCPRALEPIFARHSLHLLPRLPATPLPATAAPALA